MRRPDVVRVVLAVALAGILAGCARDLIETAWPDTIAARQQGAVDRGWVPDWLPDDATSLREQHRPRTGEAVLRATLRGGLIPDACRVVDEVGSPPLEPRWLPTPAGTTLRCGAWEARLDRDTLVAWTTEEVSS